MPVFCVPAFIVVVADNAEAAVEAVAARYPNLVGQVIREEEVALVEADHGEFEDGANRPPQPEDPEQMTLAQLDHEIARAETMGSREWLADLRAARLRLVRDER